MGCSLFIRRWYDSTGTLSKFGHVAPVKKGRHSDALQSPPWQWLLIGRIACCHWDHHASDRSPAAGARSGTHGLSVSSAPVESAPVGPSVPDVPEQQPRPDDSRTGKRADERAMVGGAGTL